MMDHERSARIESLLELFCEAAGSPAIRERHAGFRFFPRNSCTWASFTFGRLLAELEPDADWHLVNAEAADGWGGHDWLESRGLAVDVTASQFDGFRNYIGPAPAPRPHRYSGAAKRIELFELTDSQAKAFADIRRLMFPEPQIDSGGSVVGGR
jgi:hypothetical protein